jgi:hypothetical protein
MFRKSGLAQNKKMILQTRGAEAAKVHLGTKRQAASILKPDQKDGKLAPEFGNPHGPSRGEGLEPLQ